MMPRSPLALLLLGFLIVAGSGCEPEPQTDETTASEAAEVAGFFCPPCGCEDDHKTFHEAGRCPDCGMKMIAVGRYTNRDPKVSPDGSVIAFFSTRDGQAEVYTMDRNGGNQKRLTHNDKGDDENITWSPDGTQIAYTSYHLWKLSEASVAAEIYVMNADGSAKTRLTDNEAWDSQAAWSPDGAQIAFASNRDGNNEIYLIQADGSNPVNLTNHEGSDRSPRWSPDGTKIFFTSNRNGENARYAMNADGADVTLLADATNSVWSPDGSMVAFVQGPRREGDIFIRSAAGVDTLQLTDNPGVHNAAPAWSPDGTLIYFESDRDGQPEIYVMNADGSGQRRLTKQ